jgi:hypothetical protein
LVGHITSYSPNSSTVAVTHFHALFSTAYIWCHSVIIVDYIEPPVYDLAYIIHCLVNSLSTLTPSLLCCAVLHNRVILLTLLSPVINQWRDQCIQHTYDQRTNYQLCVNAAYYFNRILLIGRRPLKPSTRLPSWSWSPSGQSRFDGDPLHDYIPTFDDIMNLRLRTTGIVDSDVDLPEPSYNTLIDNPMGPTCDTHNHDDNANHHKHFERPTPSMMPSVVPVHNNNNNNENDSNGNGGSLTTPSPMMSTSSSPPKSLQLLTVQSERKANPPTIIRRNRYGSCWQLQSPLPLAIKIFDVGIYCCVVKIHVWM